MYKSNSTLIVNHVHPLINEESLLVHRPKELVGVDVELVPQEEWFVGLGAVVEAA